MGFVVFLWLCLASLLRGNVTGNELAKFEDALFYSEPATVAGFYPAEPDPGRRKWLTEFLLGPVLRHGGFLAASIAGRLAGYALLAAGFTGLARALGVRLVLLLPLLLLWQHVPSLAAGEWIIGGIEPKVFSYGLVLLVLASWLRGGRTVVRWGLGLGLACSFHVLVGFYATLAFAGLWFLERKRLAVCGRDLAAAAAVFLLAAAGAWRPVATQLMGHGMTAAVPGDVPAAFIYVFLRTPHHLDPGSWPAAWWLGAAAWLLVPGSAYAAIRAAGRRARTPAALAPARRLLHFALAAMIPFVAGLFLAPFDVEGRVLQFYLFRFGDVMLPVAGGLLAARAVQVWGLERSRRLETGVRGAVVAGAVWLTADCAERAAALRGFPGPAQGVSPEWRDCTAWIREYTPPDALFVVAPTTMDHFTWLARRRMLGTFKRTSASGGLVEWHRRMSDLAGVHDPWPAAGYAAASWLAGEYERLPAARARDLARKYGATHVVAPNRSDLGLPVVYSNAGYMVCRIPAREEGE